MAGKTGASGNPAHTRMMNPKLKARRQESWNRAQIKKRINAQENEARHKANIILRAEGKLTPHEAQKAKRKAQRDALREQGLLPPIGMSRSEWERTNKNTTKGQS